MTGPDRLPSDHPSIVTIRATVARHVGSRRRIELDDEPGLPAPEDVARVVVDERTHFARVAAHSSDGPGTRWLTALHDSAAVARNPAEGDAAPGGARLQAWLDERDRRPGGTVLVDVIEPGYALGLRAPGETVVYPAFERPDEGLAAIARELERS